MASPHEAVLDAFRRLRAAWPHRGWSYDNRFECVASSFDADFAPTARVLLGPVFPNAFTEKTLSTAAVPIRDVAQRTGGVRAQQMVFSAPSVGRITPYGLWWPWEEARTISLRVGLEGASQSELLDLQSCFGIVD